MKSQNSVDKTVPRKEIRNASVRSALLLPTTINPARYKTTARTNNSAKNNVKEKMRRIPSPIFHHGPSLTKLKIANSIMSNRVGIILNHDVYRISAGDNKKFMKHQLDFLSLYLKKHRSAVCVGFSGV